MAKPAEQNCGTAPDDEVDNDAIQLLTIATFNGVCRLIAALSESGSLSPEQLENIHDAMTTPLDDPDWRDDDFITNIRDALETVLARASMEARARQGLEIDPD